jgi:uncharacterized metal-binding protein
MLIQQNLNWMKIMEAQKSAGGCGAEGKTRIIYSCSGIGSNVGQLANAAACQLAREGYGGGSCLAGVGGGIEKLVGMGKAAGERIVIDGCPVACAKKIMDDKGLAVNKYILITDLGIAKTPGPTFSQSDVQRVIDAVRNG